MTKHSWSFNGVDMLEKYGLILEEPFDDKLQPRLRERKLVVPKRSGAYDYGAKYYDEREVIVKCASVKLLTRNDVRKLAKELSVKGELRDWHEPDKYYVGRMYESPDIERLAGVGKRFQLEFVCEPFAYGRQVTSTFINQIKMSYDGTASTPVHIVIKNTSGTDIKGLTILIRETI